MATTFVPNEGFSMGTQLIPTYTAPAATVMTVPAAGKAVCSSDSWRKFLQGEPKALGTVQIMIGVMTLLVGIVTAIYVQHIVVVYTGVNFWGPVIYICTGALAVAGANRNSPCLVKASLVMNVISAVAAGIAIIVLSIAVAEPRFLWCPPSYDYYGPRTHCEMEFVGHYIGVTGVLLVLSVLQLIISICVSAFACSASCCSQPMMLVVVNNPTASHSMSSPPSYSCDV